MLRILLLGGLLLSGSLAAKDLEAVLEWGRRVELSTVVDGMVSRVNVSPGQAVKRGELLVELDQRPLQARLAAAQAGVALAKLQQAETGRELERTLELYDRTLLSDHEKQQAEIAAASADTELRRAEAKLAQLRFERDNGRITAPFEGVVAAVSVQPGQALVNRLQPAPVVTLVEVKRMLAVAGVDAVTARTLKPGVRLQIGVRQQWLEGKLKHVGLEPMTGSAGARLYRLEAWFTPPQEMQLRAGDALVVRIDE
jgi:multidrug efflux system membrane fusion protein